MLKQKISIYRREYCIESKAMKNSEIRTVAIPLPDFQAIRIIV